MHMQKSAQGGSRTNERYADRVPPVKPPPGIVAQARAGTPLAHVLARNAPGPLVKQPRRYPPQHFPFAERAPKPGPRLWTAVPGEGIRGRETGGIS